MSGSLLNSLCCRHMWPPNCNNPHPELHMTSFIEKLIEDALEVLTAMMSWRESRTQTRTGWSAALAAAGLARERRTAGRGRTACCSRTESGSAQAGLLSACAWAGSRRWSPGSEKIRWWAFVAFLLGETRWLVWPLFSPSEWSDHSVWWCPAAASALWPLCAQAPAAEWRRLLYKSCRWPPPHLPVRAHTHTNSLLLLFPLPFISVRSFIRQKSVDETFHTVAKIRKGKLSYSWSAGCGPLVGNEGT